MTVDLILNKQSRTSNALDFKEKIKWLSLFIKVITAVRCLTPISPMPFFFLFLFLRLAKKLAVAWVND